MTYFVKTPGWLKMLYPLCTWQIKTTEKILFLTFDDGPHPVATPFVLQELKKYTATATFFCIGKNVGQHLEIYDEILNSGHAVGNHTYNHLNGWKNKPATYINDIEAAGKLIGSKFFRPPYGKIKWSAVKTLSRKLDMKVIMWSVLSGDFDTGITKEKCLDNVLGHAKSGSIIVFHDSAKALDKLMFTLPRVLSYFSERGYLFKKIDL